MQEIFGKIATETQELVQGEAMDVYGEIYYRAEQMEKRKAQIALADPPTVTTDAIDHALFDKYPRTRYIVANFSKVRGHGQGGRRRQRIKYSHSEANWTHPRGGTLSMTLSLSSTSALCV